MKRGDTQICKQPKRAQRECVQSLRGDLAVAAQPKQGTRIEAHPGHLEGASMSMKKSKPKPRLLLADDHAIVMEGLSRLLEADFQIVGTVGDGRALLEAAQKLKPDVIVADLSMPLLNGLEALRQLRRANLRSKVVILSMHADVEFASEAMRRGASAYVVKHSASQSLSRAIQQVLEGRTFVSPRIALDVWPAVSAPSQSAQPAATHLTQREREVLQLVAEGRTINGIATILKIAARTVVFHKSNLMDKLGLRTTADLTRYAIRSGLVPALPLR